jgi:hypothetical protein
MQEYQIQRRQKGCSVCGKIFGPGEELWSAILCNPEGFVRLDYCLGCFERDKGEPFCYWRNTTPLPTVPRRENLDAVVEFFKKVSAQAQKGQKEQRLQYVLALILMRRKRLKLLRHQLADQHHVLVLEKVWDGETVEVLDQHIPEDEFDELRDQIQQIFEPELG